MSKYTNIAKGWVREMCVSPTAGLMTFNWQPVFTVVQCLYGKFPARGACVEQRVCVLGGFSLFNRWLCNDFAAHPFLINDTLKQSWIFWLEELTKDPCDRSKSRVVHKHVFPQSMAHRHTHIQTHTNAKFHQLEYL